MYKPITPSHPPIHYKGYIIQFDWRSSFYYVHFGSDEIGSFFSVDRAMQYIDKHIEIKKRESNDNGNPEVF